ncbi:MAG: heme-binding protein [Pseudomonadota bacterium]
MESRSILCSLVLVSAPLMAFAELPREPVLPLALAQKAALAAVQQCERDGYRVSASVVDKSGVVRAQLRADGAGAHTLQSSFRKAYTSASLREPTSKLAKIAASSAELQGLHHVSDDILLLGGGLPIVIGGEAVGGIGVGGAPGAQLDEACAQAGLQSILDAAGSKPAL